MKPDGLVPYLYCLMAPGGTLAPGLAGIEQRPVYLRDCGATNAILSDVAVDSFCGEEAEQRLQKLEWVGPRALRHAQVIEQAMATGPVLPVGFATLFTSLESLEQTVDRKRDAIAAFFRELGDRQEWAVKGSLLHPQPPAVASGAAEPHFASGANYLFRKQAQIASERASADRLKEVCHDLAAELGVLAHAFKERKVVEFDREAAKTSRAVFHWAFLVNPSDAAAFAAHVQASMQPERFPGLRLALSGPWPAFSFAPHLQTEEKP